MSNVELFSYAVEGSKTRITVQSSDTSHEKWSHQELSAFLVELYELGVPLSTVVLDLKTNWLPASTVESVLSKRGFPVPRESDAVVKSVEIVSNVPLELTALRAFVSSIPEISLGAIVQSLPPKTNG